MTWMARSSVRSIAVTAGLLLHVFGHSALAQNALTSFETLSARTKVGETVVVARADGRDVEGKLSTLSSSSLSISTGKAMTHFPSSAIRRVYVRGPRPIGKGALIGLAVGAGTGFIAVAASDRSHNCFPIGCAAAELMVGGFFGGIGAGMGALIGAGAEGKKILVYEAGTPPSSTDFSASVIYERSVGTRSASLRMSPILDRGHRGFQISLRF